MGLIILFLVAHAVTMARFAQSYYMISSDLKGVFEPLPVGRPRQHLSGASGFIWMCAGSHVVAFFELLLMATMMLKAGHSDLPDWLIYSACGFYGVTLIFLVIGGEFSHHRAVRLREDRNELHQFVSSLWGDRIQGVREENE